jgi:hypothetical protein
VVSITLKPILTTGLQNDAQPNDEKQSQLPTSKKNESTKKQDGSPANLKQPPKPISTTPNPKQPTPRQYASGTDPTGPRFGLQSWKCFIDTGCRSDLFSDVRPFEWGGLTIAAIGVLVGLRTLRQIAGLFGVPATTRNWNTIAAVIKVLKGHA